VWLILASVAVVMLDSFEHLHARWGAWFELLEWGFTAVFTLEYAARLACVQRPARYARSVLGMIDLLAVLPTWLALFLPGLHALIDVRLLRLLRLFRILKLAAYVDEYMALGTALMASRRKIMVFLSFVLLVVVVLGTVMYVVEGPQNGFANVPVSVYWAISTMTTVGFGDITPKTGTGRFIASVMMLIGWGTLAVPTGIVSAEFTALRFRRVPGVRICDTCGADGHDEAARFCNRCGARLPDPGSAGR
jgi:voltage-gated potassium channel